MNSKLFSIKVSITFILYQSDIEPYALKGSGLRVSVGDLVKNGQNMIFGV